MITLHHLNNSRSQRILWMLEELKLPYEIKCYERNKVTMLAPPELKEVHPLGKAPILTDGELVLAESGAIIEYLVNTYDVGLRPSGVQERLNYTYFLHYAEGSLMPPLLLTLIFQKVEKAPWPIRPVAKIISGSVKKTFIGPNLKAHFDFLENHLEKNSWFTGESFSAADIQMSFPLEAAHARGALKNRPRIAEFLKQIHARPAYQRAIEKGGTYDYAN